MKLDKKIKKERTYNKRSALFLIPQIRSIRPIRVLIALYSD